MSCVFSLHEGGVDYILSHFEKNPVNFFPFKDTAVTRETTLTLLVFMVYVKHLSSASLVVKQQRIFGHEKKNLVMLLFDLEKMSLL